MKGHFSSISSCSQLAASADQCIMTGAGPAVRIQCGGGGRIPPSTSFVRMEESFGFFVYPAYLSLPDSFTLLSANEAACYSHESIGMPNGKDEAAIFCTSMK